ncbi:MULTISPECIES: carbohydrate ABC transporter permease [unclassified Actinomyces]|uniref:carbohydrate ABC transporter permease n=1 Tax=unclassified Actinomyces TaxID=2609248 RepID=UPI0020181D98|nr:MULTISPECIES: carbohydrate ABC transporter permease [unclassified Actinomyces]MCL3777348.1 carbohydrate ABC transporter permease [Actinomyces sp. AC-20-1]MCL3790482.1 carbohydrate ABC transporter permease [Actinomyces sp. 187325]MCL3792750.1 carbohydrate ABC transporter permease [Actinomyces sp. 186855]MCL3794946.1 carbohydrate ABC transporter permease [Actinomyces sp. 217892]
MTTTAPSTQTARRRPLRPRTLLLYVTLVVFALAYVFPFLVNVATSFKTGAEATSDPLGLVPETFTTSAYAKLFGASNFPLWMRNSVIVTCVVTLGRVLFDSMAGYALARIPFRGRVVVYVLLVAVMSVPGVVLLIPKFLVINQLSMYDSWSGLIIPLLCDATGIFIMKGFFESVPASIEEQARVDGAGTWQTFFSIVLPMSVPSIVTITILSFQGSWNELSHFIVASRSPELVTLTKGVAQLSAGSLGQGNQYPLKLGAALIMTIPVAVLFFVFQRRIMDTSSGAVKE